MLLLMLLRALQRRGRLGRVRLRPRRGRGLSGVGGRGRPSRRRRGAGVAVRRVDQEGAVHQARLLVLLLLLRECERVGRRELAVGLRRRCGRGRAQLLRLRRRRRLRRRLRRRRPLLLLLLLLLLPRRGGCRLLERLMLRLLV